MAKYDDQLNRMSYLMEFSSPSTNKNKISSPVAFHTTGADGKIYGIIKEGIKYYIKTTIPGNELIAESYEYIGGFNSKKENEFPSYDKATKHLEVKIINLNESYGKHEDVSVVDFKSGEKNFSTLTEEARKELNRVNQIFENSTKIGQTNTGTTEYKGTASADNTTKNNKPFEEKVNISIDKDVKTNGTVKGATENKEVTNVDSDLQSDKMKTGGVSDKDYTDAHDDLEGEGVSDQHPSGGKVTHVNESIEEENFDIEDINNDGIEDIDINDNPDGLDDIEDININDNPDGLENLDIDLSNEPSELAGFESNNNTVYDDYERILQETEDLIAGNDKTMDNYNSKGTLPVQSCDKVKNNKDSSQSVKQGNEETMKNYQSKGTLPVQSWDKVNETIETITRQVCNEIFKKKNKKPIKESFDEKITRLVKEEIKNLNIWGKHPRYGKEPMTLPDNKEVNKGTADHDWNDDSVKQNTVYGKKIGNSAPFDQTVEMLTDSVLTALKESLLKKK